MRRPASRMMVIGGAVVLVLGSCVAAIWGLRHADPAVEEAAAKPYGAGARAVIDPRTGGLATDPEVIRKAIAARVAGAPRDPLSSSGEGLFSRQLPNGLVAVDLRGRFMQPLVVTIPPGEAAEGDVVAVAGAASESSRR